MPLGLVEGYYRANYEVLTTRSPRNMDYMKKLGTALYCLRLLRQALKLIAFMVGIQVSSRLRRI